MNSDITTVQLKDYIQGIVGRQITLILTDNTSSMISVKFSKSRSHNILIVRLQKIFLIADSEIHDEIASFILNRKTPLPKTNLFIKENSNIINSNKSKRYIKLRPLGRHYNLEEIYNRINEAYFENSIASQITWGRKAVRRSVKIRRLGSYNRISNIITINRILDSTKVPLYYVEFIVYHEMLHAHIGIVKNGSRNLIHTREFRDLEKKFIGYNKIMGSKGLRPFAGV
ncbi:MAG: hypothetical protein HQK91_12225 [Nitrospirae bacterium]|nr:hypothetical protein [Nitrospirota bacterium]MBF0542202.1 hypothetical protein [Nitrospirota bacterium]